MNVASIVQNYLIQEFDQVDFKGYRLITNELSDSSSQKKLKNAIGAIKSTTQNVLLFRKPCQSFITIWHIKILLHLIDT